MSSSAVVSYTLGKWAVNLVTAIFESKGKDTNQMDGHNKKIGADIGNTVSSFSELEGAVRRRVQSGRVNSSGSDQITWLLQRRWRDSKLW